MLRIGKNPKDQEDNEHADKQEGTPYGAPRSYTPSHQAVDTQTRPPVEASASSRALTESESLARDIKEGTLSGFVGGGTVVTGEATFKAMMRVDGHLSGRISSSSGTLVVGTNGRVDANIEVAVATIHGIVNGDVIATQRLELGRAAKVNGNIQTPSLVIEQGAIFEGSCKMAQVAAVAEKGKTALKVREDRPLDTTGMKPVGADSPKATEITSISDVAS
jgi:cytoskeletal protein CcmA (bactofilin family)